MHPGPRLLVGFLLLSLALATGIGPMASGQAYPTYAPGDFWVYAVEVRLDTLPGVGNVSGALVAEGETRAEVAAVADGETTLAWAGGLTLQGGLMLPGGTAEAAVSGTIETTYVERLEQPYFLPVAFVAQTTLDVTVTLIGSFPAMATLDLNATMPPTTASPTYPLEEGSRTFGTSATVASNVTVDFPGMRFQNSTLEEVPSTIRWDVTPSASVVVPAGTFSGVQVTLEAVTGFVPSPLQGLIPGAVQITHHSPAVGSPVLFRFLVDGTEVGMASLKTYASGVPPPFWQGPIFLGGLLAIPVALLLYRYWRERRRGL